MELFQSPFGQVNLSVDGCRRKAGRGYRVEYAKQLDSTFAPPKMRFPGMMYMQRGPYSSKRRTDFAQTREPEDETETATGVNS
jgi:hypothetical protein